LSCRKTRPNRSRADSSNVETISGADDVSDLVLVDSLEEMGGARVAGLNSRKVAAKSGYSLLRVDSGQRVEIRREHGGMARERNYNSPADRRSEFHIQPARSQ
jgi:hypothetical protein